MLELLVTAPFHALFGVAVMSSTTLLTTVFAHPPASWGLGPLSDEHTAGAIAWGFSELPTLLVVLALVVMWARSSDREVRSTDRRADRNGDRERRAYNERLAALAELDRE